ncbi:MAG TPA: dynamin family protein [Chthoniobacterales bacterium]|jgi:small GTP-binding protein|nr:dynamin family protein [Chthoniobacterales bacterium]
MIADRYLQLKGELEGGLAGLIKLGSEMHRPPEELDTLQALLCDIAEPLLFVVVGEVKSGKSSLLNALFGNEFAKVDVLPATDRVYIFRYGTDAKTTEVSPKLTERYLPIPFLRDFNVVDTPGTNTMVKEHQMTTEDFMPRADIVLFVFSVANPWTQSNWEFLNFLQKTWLKNVIFILQQIDLREPTEIEVIHRHLQDTAMRQLGFVPPIFAISARKALLARTSGLDREKLWEESAFGPLEEQINFIVTESSTRMLKLRSTFQAARVVLEERSREIGDLLGKISGDESALARLDALLQNRREQLRRQTGSLVREIESGYDRTTSERTKLLRQNVTWLSGFKLIFGGKAQARDLHTRVEAKLRALMQPQIDKVVSALETDLRSVWPQMQDLLENQLSADLRKEARPNIPDFSGQRRELHETIQRAFLDILAGKPLQDRVEQSFSRSSIAIRIASAVMIVAGVAAALLRTHNVSMAIGASAVAVIGLLLAIFIALNHRRKILRDYERELDPKRPEFKQELDLQFGKAIDSFCAELSKRFQKLVDICNARRARYEPWSQTIGELQTKFSELKSRLG